MEPGSGAQAAAELESEVEALNSGSGVQEYLWARGSPSPGAVQQQIFLVEGIAASPSPGALWQ